MCDGDSPIDLKELFLEIIPHSLTPEKVLQILSSGSPTPSHRADIIPFITFCASVKYIMLRLPDGFVDGVWEEILRKLIMYTQTFSFLMRTEMYCVITLLSPRLEPYNHPAMTRKLRSWIGEVLSSYSNCPNPFLRLELFRLMRLLAFRNERYVNLESVCETFIHTICEVYPLHFYPKGNEDMMLFRVKDFYYFIKQLRRYNLLEHLSETEDFLNSRAATFVSHFIQLIAVFARMASFTAELELCSKMLKMFWTKYYYVLSRPQYHHYAVESFREVTDAIINSIGLVEEKTIMLDHIREFPSQDLGDYVCSKPCDLPRLLMSRQVQGPRALRQHALISRDPSLLYKWDYPKSDTVTINEGENSSDSDNISDDSNGRANDSNYVTSSNYDESSSDSFD